FVFGNRVLQVALRQGLAIDTPHLLHVAVVARELCERLRPVRAHLVIVVQRTVDLILERGGAAVPELRQAEAAVVHRRRVDPGARAADALGHARAVGAAAIGVAGGAGNAVVPREAGGVGRPPAPARPA